MRIRIRVPRLRNEGGYVDLTKQSPALSFRTCSTFSLFPVASLDFQGKMAAARRPLLSFHCEKSRGVTLSSPPTLSGFFMARTGESALPCPQL